MRRGKPWSESLKYKEEQDSRPGLVVLTYDPKVWKTEKGGSEFEVSLGYRKPVSKLELERSPESLKALRFILISGAFHFCRMKVVMSLCGDFLHHKYCMLLLPRNKYRSVLWV